jgi:hypothetical protein
MGISYDNPSFQRERQSLLRFRSRTPSIDGVDDWPRAIVRARRGSQPNPKVASIIVLVRAVVKPLSNFSKPARKWFVAFFLLRACIQ